MIAIGRQILMAILALYLVPTARTFQCPAGLTWEALPDPSDCSHYFLCVQSQAHHRACSPHLYFNPLTERCDSASKPYCAANSSSLPTFNNTVVNTTALPPTTPPPTFKCPSNQTVQYPDITNCVFYFLCQNGSSVRLECANGTAFHVLSSSCVSAPSGQCPPLVALTTTPSPSSATTSSATQLNSSLPAASPFPGASQPAGAQSSTPFPSGASQPAGAQSSTPFPSGASQPAGAQSSTPFPPGASQPAGAQSSTPFPTPPLGPSAPFKCPPDSGNRLYADDTSCNYYYECVGRLAYRMPCADGLHFNPTTQLCDYPYIVNCAIPPANVSVSPSVFECPRVPTNPANLYPDPQDCGYFYQCAGTRAFHIACQPGLYFQPYIYVCVRPEQSSCSNGSGQNGTSGGAGQNGTSGGAGQNGTSGGSGESGEGSGGSGENGEGSGGSGESGEGSGGSGESGEGSGGSGESGEGSGGSGESGEGSGGSGESGEGSGGSGENGEGSGGSGESGEGSGGSGESGEGSGGSGESGGGSGGSGRTAVTSAGPATVASMTPQAVLFNSTLH